MKKFILFLILVLSIGLIAQDDGYIEFVFQEDSLTIWHYGAWRNCGAVYKMDLEMVGSTIYLTENDTSSMWAWCMCYFDLATSISLPAPGLYHLIIQTTSKIQSDIIPVADTSFSVGNIGLISYSNPGCMTNSKKETGTEIPLIDHYESDCQNSQSSSLYASSYDTNVLVTWYADSVNCFITPKWTAILSNDTLNLSLIDTGTIEDCTCPKYLTARFGPLPSGTYIVNFLDGKLGYPKFIVEEQIVLQIENSDLILNWDVAELNCCLETQWDAWLVGDTFYVTMTDTGAPCDCICPFELSARFGPFEPGDYTLDFQNTNLGLFNFTIGRIKKVALSTVLSSFQSECYNIVEIEQYNSIPSEFTLLFCYPNPFNSVTKIAYFIPKAMDMHLKIIDINGRLIEKLESGFHDRGSYGISWDASRYSSGIYMITLLGSETKISKKILLLK